MSVERGIVLEEEARGIALLPDLLADLGWQPDDDLTIEVIENGFTTERAHPDAA